MGNLVSIITGYIYWIIASRFVEPNIVGTAAAIISFYRIFVTLFSLGLQTGIKRYLGISLGEKNFLKLSKFFFTTLVILIIINIPITIYLIYSIFNPIVFINFTSIQLFFILILFLFDFISPLLISFFTSIIKTEIIAIGYIISALLKISLGTLILCIFPNFFGIMYGFIIGLSTFTLVLLIYTLKTFSKKKIKPKIDFSTSKEVIKASLPAYLPSMLNLLGQSLGTLIIYSFVGAYETGLYFIAFSIASLIYALSRSITILLYPILSSMKEGQENETNKVINLSLTIGTPLAVIFCVYASIPLLFFGSSYVDAVPLLVILITGAILFPVYTGYYGYIYAKGKFTHVTILGLTLNGSRIILYFTLVGFLGDFGIALSYSLGVIIVIFAMIFSIKKLRFPLKWNVISKILLIPIVIGFLLYFFNIFWLLGIPVLIFVPLISYIKMNILQKEEVNQIISSFISERTKKYIYQKTQPLIHFLFKEN